MKQKNKNRFPSARGTGKMHLCFRLFRVSHTHTHTHTHTRTVYTDGNTLL